MFTPSPPLLPPAFVVLEVVVPLPVVLELPVLPELVLPELEVPVLEAVVDDVLADVELPEPLVPLVPVPVPETVPVVVVVPPPLLQAAKPSAREARTRVERRVERITASSLCAKTLKDSAYQQRGANGKRPRSCY
jgi:hypothetical protein